MFCSHWSCNPLFGLWVAGCVNCIVSDIIHVCLKTCNVLYTGQAHYKEKGAVAEEEAQIHRIRITLTSRNVKSLEKG